MADQPRDERPDDGMPGGTRRFGGDPGPAGSGEPDGPGETRRFEAQGAGQPLDETHPQEAVPSEGGHDPWASGAETTVLPPAGDDANRWTARAGVPAVEETSTEVWPEPEPGGADRRWWAPALIGLLALVLLGMLGLGVWLISRARDNPLGPVPSATPTPTRAPTSAPPTSAPPSPTASAVAQVAIPPLVGLQVDDAQRLLTERGLLSTVENRVDRGATPGTVLEASPAPGTMVPVGSTVKLVVAVAPPPPTTPAAPTPTAAPTPSS